MTYFALQSQRSSYDGASATQSAVIVCCRLAHQTVVVELTPLRGQAAPSVLVVKDDAVDAA